MERQIRQYTPDGQLMSGAVTDNSKAIGNDAPRSQGTGESDVSDESGPIHDSDEDESGVDRRGRNTDVLTGTDKDETGSDENMATES